MTTNKPMANLDELMRRRLELKAGSVYLYRRSPRSGWKASAEQRRNGLRLEGVRLEIRRLEGQIRTHPGGAQLLQNEKSRMDRLALVIATWSFGSVAALGIAAASGSKPAEWAVAIPLLGVPIAGIAAGRIK